MTTDASPVNRYLLFDRSDEFSTNDKVMYALQAGRVFGDGKEMNVLGMQAPLSRAQSCLGCTPFFERDMRKRFLVRTLDEVKRAFTNHNNTMSTTHSERPAGPITPSTDATMHTGNYSMMSSTDFALSHTLHGSNEMGNSPNLMDDNDDLDTRPWENPGAQATYWNWPIETLYQNYHVIFAIDFGQSTFDVSANGEVFADRIPSIVSALLHVIETTLRARDADASAIRAWLNANVADEETRTRIMGQVWDPQILVSVMLVNAPRPVEIAVPFAPCKSEGKSKSRAAGGATSGGGGSGSAKAPPFSEENDSGSDSEGGEDGFRDEVPIFPPSHTLFNDFEADGGTASADNTLCTGIPIMSRVDARRLVKDHTAIERLRDALLMYENACRQRGDSTWPESNLSSTLEYLIRTAPEPAKECHSFVLTTNTRSLFCSDTLSFLESVVRRKNLIISVVTLNRLFAIDSPRLSPLAQFLSAIGGFAVQVDYWLSLSATRLNSDWCHRFEGARCLGQQLFVHLVNQFPVAAYGITQRHALLAEQSDRVALYDSEKGLPDFVAGRSTLSLLRAVSSTRFNEGWSVLIDYRDEASAAHLVARYQHYFHRGSLVLHYEMDINRPVVYRRLFVSGTRALVDHFSRLRIDEQGLDTLSESLGTWLTYLALLRLQVHGWIKAEQTMLDLLNVEPRSTPPLADIQKLSSIAGVMSEWLNMCSVAAFGVFARNEGVQPAVGIEMMRTPAAMSPMPAATDLLRRIMMRRHRQVGNDSDLTFMQMDDGTGGSAHNGAFLYILQFFPFHQAAAPSTGDSSGGAVAAAAGVAGGFECRASFFFCDAETQQMVLRVLVDELVAGCDGNSDAAPVQEVDLRLEGKLRLRSALSLSNEQSLLLVISFVAPRRMELLSYYTENLGASPSGNVTSALPGGAPVSRPPLLPKGRPAPANTSPAAQLAAAAAQQYQPALLQRSLRSPYVSFPWVLANARTFKWAFACEDRFDAFGQEVFNFAVMRRVHAGYGVLVCYNGLLKAALHRKIKSPWGADNELVDMFDLIEAGGASNTAAAATTFNRLTAGAARYAGAALAPSAAGMGLSIFRLAAPYKHVQGTMATQVLIEDIAEDVHIAVALFSYKVYSRRPNAVAGMGLSGGGGGVGSAAAVAAAERWAAALQGHRRLGTTVIKARMDSLIPYLTASHTELLQLACPRTLGADGCLLLRDKMKHLVAAMGDRRTLIPCAAFSRQMLHHLGIIATADAAIPRDRRILVSLLYPIRYSTITFLLIGEKGSAVGHNGHVVPLAISFLDASLLHYGLTQRYRGSTGGQEMPECTPDTAVVASIKHVLTSFASIYCCRRVIDSVVGIPQRPGQPAGDSSDAMSELAKLSEELDVYASEMDVTHLLMAELGRCGGDFAKARVQLHKVLATLSQLDARCLAARPALFFPCLERVSSVPSPSWLTAATYGDHGEGELRSDIGDLSRTLPVIFSTNICFECRDPATGASRRTCEWVSRAYEDEAALSFTTDTSDRGWSLAGDPADASRPTRMVLRVFLKTVPCELLDLFATPDFTPPHSVVRNVLRYLLYHYSPNDPLGAVSASPLPPLSATGGRISIVRLAGGAASDEREGRETNARRHAAALLSDPAVDPLHVTGTDVSVEPRAVQQLWRRCRDFSAFPEAVERAVRRMVVEPLVVKCAAFALYSTFYSRSFLDLQKAITGSERPPERLPGLVRTKDGQGTLLFTQPDASLSRCGEHVVGFADILRDVVSPALNASTAFQAVVFPVEFTKQATSYRSVDPKEAALDVFRRCTDEDVMCIMPTSKELAYALVPNVGFFGKRWLVVQMDIQSSLLINKASILYFDAETTAAKSDGRSPRAVSRVVRTHMYTKITQISQLHLLKQLRDSQNANTELIPVNWGNQFSGSSGGRAVAPRGSSSRGGTVAATGQPRAFTGQSLTQTSADCSSQPSAGSHGSTNFYLRGTDALRIPIYYKLQQNCQRILNFITNNSTRLELFQIYNREQCFVVADDEESDTFHYIRLVFVKEVGQELSPLQPAPRISQTDRCPEMVVQLFTATTNASIRGPLRKLQDFCYLLAVQELQGHLNYVNSISFNDLVFLQNQPLPPMAIDVTENVSATSAIGAAATKDDVQLALSLLFLNLRENKYKLLDFQDSEHSHTKSVFVKHYTLEDGARAGKKTVAPRNPSTGTSSSPDAQQALQIRQQQPGGASKQNTMRFVKVVDGSTDVLCSCALRWTEDPDDPNAHLLYLDRYLTKVPSERYINGESERAIMKQLSDLVEDTKAQLAFHVLSRQQSPSMPMAGVPGCADKLLSIAARVTSADSSLLRFKSLPLEDVSPAVVPYLIERLCGSVKSFSPRCCQGTVGNHSAVEPLTAFSWEWMERQQNDPLTDEKEVYILCGYPVSQGRDDAAATPSAATVPPKVLLLAETHVLPYGLPDIAVTTTTTEEHHIAVLREQNLSPNGAVMALRIVIRVSLVDGLTIGAFNMRDSEYLTRLLATIVSDMEEKSLLLRNILMQRLGFTAPSPFTEADLARNCCGDATNVIPGKPLAITGDTYRRRVNNVRFRPHLEEESCGSGAAGDDSVNDLAIIIEGLYNRGLIVNYVFPVEDAITVLFNERSGYPLDRCERVVIGFLREGVLVQDETSALKPQAPLFRIAYGTTGSAALRHRSFNCRLAEVSGAPADALIACDYHRHALATHIIVEAQNARSEVAEVLSTCDELWRAGPQEHVIELAKAIVMLQMKSKQVFGSRVPDFSLRRERWRPDDDVLEATVPPHGGRGPSLATAVDAALRSYMQHLRQLYPSMCVIDLDPSDPHTTGEEVLLNRLKCRYGKVTIETGAAMRFGTHLYYAIVPFSDLLRCKSMHERYGYVLPMLLPPDEDLTVAPITSSGVFVVEVGFQVVHYALDFFVVNGSSVPLSVAARVAADFTQSLMFDSILYDASVKHLQDRLQSYAAEVTGYVDTATAAANLIKYYPSPPVNSVNIASVLRVADPRVMRLRNLPHSRGVTPATGKRAGKTGYMHLIPDRTAGAGGTLIRARTGEVYRFCGVISWDTAQLYVLLATERDPALSGRVPNDDLPAMVMHAKRLLLAQLLESTQQERVDAAWDKFLCDRARPHAVEPLPGPSAATAKDLPSLDEFELLRNQCQRVVLQSYRNVLQSTVGDVEWVGDPTALERTARRLLPDGVLRVLWKQFKVFADDPARRAFGDGTDGPGLTAGAVGGASVARPSIAAVSPPLPPGAAPSNGPASPSLAVNSPAPTTSLTGIGGYDVNRLFASNGLPGRVILTLADNNAGGTSFLAMECWSMPGCSPPFVVEDISLLRKPESSGPQLSLVAVVTPEDSDLLRKFMLLMSNSMWSTVIPCPTQLSV